MFYNIVPGTSSLAFANYDRKKFYNVGFSSKVSVLYTNTLAYYATM